MDQSTQTPLPVRKANAWTDHIKKEAKRLGLSYSVAMLDERVKQSYHQTKTKSIKSQPIPIPKPEPEAKKPEAYKSTSASAAAAAIPVKPSKPVRRSAAERVTAKV